MRLFLGWAVAFAAVIAAACGSSGGPGDGPGAAGASGQGGARAGGASGTMAAHGGSEDGSAAGAGGAPVGCPDGTVVPASPTIADFTPADGGPSIGFMGGTTSFGTPAPELKVSGANLHAQATVVAGAEPQTVGFGIYFRRCVDAGAYSGVKFDMSGTVTGCRMSYAFNFSEDVWNGSLVDAGTEGDSKGACTLGATACYPPSATITAATQTVLFSAVSGGAPVHAVDKGRLTGLVWQFAVGARPDGGPNSACSIDVTVDNIAFVP